MASFCLADNTCVFNLVTFSGHITNLEVFTLDGALSHKFSIAPDDETTDESQELWSAKNWDGPPLSAGQVCWRLYITHWL